MYSIIQSVINAGSFELTDILRKIDTLWLKGNIDDDQRTELIDAAREKADPSSSYAPLQEQVDKLAEKIKALEDQVTHIEQGEPDDPPVVEEWPEFVRPTGAHDAYNTGDKITYNGEHYTCQMNGCVWSPADYPSAWKKEV